VRDVRVDDENRVAFVTQTTLSVDDSRRIVALIRERFPNVQGPAHDDICYATQNRQAAVNALVVEADLVLVVGDPESANSTRLANICETKGKQSHLISSFRMIDPQWLENVDTILITSGASAPEKLVQEVVEHLKALTPCDVEEREVAVEDVHFVLPDAIR